MKDTFNIADRLRESAQAVPDQQAVVVPHAAKKRRRITFRELDTEVDQLARGLIAIGIRPGHRLVLMVRPSIDFIALTFAIFRTGAVCTLIDPGMGRSNIFDCLAKIEPIGFVAISQVQFLRMLMSPRFASAQINVDTGWFSWLTDSYSLWHILKLGQQSRRDLPATQITDVAAIIFTSGSTGPPKGVVYEHGMFNAQVDLIQTQYRIAPGEVDLPGFPLFALFNLAMQVTTVIPDMDPTRPADADPERIVRAIDGEQVTQAYGSPALWNQVGRHCELLRRPLPRLNRVLSAGAPVPLHVLRRMTASLRPDADLHTPYGATECLPVATIIGREVLTTTAALTANGSGTCVGRVFHGVEVRIIAITDKPIASITDAPSLAPGKIGEIIVRSPCATREYFQHPEGTAMAKILDGATFWHRMGDCGYFDDQQRLWFCGRKAHIVWTANGPMHSVCCEEIFNAHPDVFRSALIGLGAPGQQEPVLVVELENSRQRKIQVDRVLTELREIAEKNDLTRSIQRIEFHKSLPVDTRHNIKINRELLAKHMLREG